MTLDATRQNLMREAVAYFRSRPGFDRVLEGLAAKYRSLGRLGGMLVLDQLSEEERESLERFLRCRLPGNPVRLAVHQFIGALRETRFGELDPLDLLAEWQGGPLISFRQQRETDESARQRMLMELMECYPQPLCQAWLQAILDNAANSHYLQRAGATDPDFRGNLATALRALASIPEQYLRLPVFASQVCGDPHGLDLDRGAGKLFLEGLRFSLRGQAPEGEPETETADSGTLRTAAEEVSELLYRFKLLRDDLLNFATCFGLTAYADQREIAYWTAAAEASAPLNVPLRELVSVTALRPINREVVVPGMATDRFAVYLVENSGVFSALLDECAVVQKPMVCLHGQFKLASWALLDRLALSGALFLYSGDFDPEGLQIAQKLFRRYPGRVRAWRMTEADYQNAAPSVPLEAARLRKLQSVQIPELEPLARCIAARGLAAYQEALLPELEADLLAGAEPEPFTGDFCTNDTPLDEYS